MELERLWENQTNKFYDIFQKAGLQNLVLERNLQNLQNESAEKRTILENVLGGSNEN